MGTALVRRNAYHTTARLVRLLATCIHSGVVTYESEISLFLTGDMWDLQRRMVCPYHLLLPSALTKLDPMHSRPARLLERLLPRLFQARGGAT